MVVIQSTTFLVVLPEYKDGTAISEPKLQTETWLCQMPALLKSHWVRSQKRDIQRHQGRNREKEGEGETDQKAQV